MQSLIRVLVVGFMAVILLLVAAAVIGVNNARSIARSSADLVSDQLLITRLLDEVEREQQVLNAAFYRLSRTPEGVNRERVLADLDRTDREIDRLVRDAAGRPDREVWANLHRATLDFSNEARRLLLRRNVPPATSRDLFAHHEQVTTVVAKLVDLRYARA